MTEHTPNTPSTREYSEDEIALELALQQASGTPEVDASLTALETFLSAKTSLMSTVESVLGGTASSDIDAMEYTQLLHNELTSSYANAVMTSPEEDRPQVGAELLVSVFNDLSAVSEDYDIDLKGALSYDDSQFPQLVEQVAYLLEDETEESARTYLMGFLSPVIEHSIVHLYTVNETENINDQKKERNKAILDRSIDIAIGIGKVAAGAVLAGLALSAIQKRRR
jgi:hypothetical protein